MRLRCLDHNRLRLPSPLRSRVCTETAHNARCLGQPFLWCSTIMSLGMKRSFDLRKSHSYILQRERQIEEHHVTSSWIRRRYTPCRYGRLNYMKLLRGGPPQRFRERGIVALKARVCRDIAHPRQRPENKLAFPGRVRIRRALAGVSSTGRGAPLTSSPKSSMPSATE